jgi:predicted Holliday junction resolvase-like endonuclease
MVIFVYTLLIISVVYVYSKQIVKHKQTVDDYKKQLDTYRRFVPDFSSIVPMSHYKEAMEEKNSQINNISTQLGNVEKELSELKSQQQSKSVRLGLISENVLPFHSDFKYNVKDLVPMFRPIDYIVFAEDEIVFLEIKMGTSQLSEKQKKIRSLINSGKVRFEEHRVNENGYSVKESHGKETQG